MISILEIFPTEILFEIFDYLTTYDIFYSLNNLNKQINDIIQLYPLNLNFQQISRSKFDFICRYIKPEQVISISFSDEIMPNQVELFKQYFPNFQYKFISLKKFIFNNTSTILSHLPICLTSLSIKTYLKTKQTDYLIMHTLNQQSQYLTYLKVDGSYVFRSINTSFPLLTHLIIDYCTITDFHRILHCLQSPIIYLKLSLYKEENLTLINFQSLSKSLLQLSLLFSQEILISFQSIKQSIEQLDKLISLTIQATGTLDLMNGQLWEEYLIEKQIKIFNFKFTLAHHINCQEDKQSLLQTFRSLFWLKKKNWYVACEKGNFKSSRPILYSIPYFQPSFIFYPSNNFLSDTIIEKEIHSNHIFNLILTFYKTITIPTTPFTNVYSLTLFTTTLPSIEILLAIVNLEQIQELDVSLIKNLSIVNFQILIASMKKLKSIKMQYNPFFCPPLHIDSYIFIRNDREIFVIDENNLDRFCYLFYFIKYLEITVKSKEIILQLLKRLHYLEIVKIYCYQDYLINIKYNWFQENIPRLNTNYFTYRTTSSCLLLSIGDRKIMNAKTIPETIDDDSVKPGCYKIRSHCVLQ
ncbi:unnamed protein product [Adineta steineri]|uniref:F-box domain-containing protein n=1 Tax=Adineta steineri TaxID=433720 RepID=A0A818R0U2_9BILA|nr:unnamed protein product [Adineta steineri]